MKLLYISLECASFTVFSGNGVLSCTYTQNLVALGHEVLALCGCPDEPVHDFVIDKGDVPACLVQVPRWRRLDMEACYLEFAAGAVAKHHARIASFGADIILGVDWTSLHAYRALIECAALKTSVPLVYLNFRVFHRNMPITPVEFEFFSRVEREMCEASRLCIALCQNDREELLKLRPSLPIDIIPCPLRAEIHSISRQHLSDSVERNLVVCCSRLSPEKNVELFVDLMCHPKMVSAMRRLHLQPCLVGATVDQKYAQSLTARLYASHPDAECHDFMPAAQLSQLFLRSCLYFHASLNESFGMTILEAAAFAAAPAMNCRRIGAGDLLNESNSIKLDFDLPLDDTVGSIVELISDRAKLLSIGNRAREFALTQTERRGSEKLVSSISQVLS